MSLFQEVTIIMSLPDFDAIFGEVAECMTDSIELFVYKDEREFDFCFEKYGYTINGNGMVGGEWRDNGNDGWNEPIEYFLINSWGRIRKLEIYYTDDSTGEETYFDAEAVRDIKHRLENELCEYMRNYC